jgi:hypothetical protein
MTLLSLSLLRFRIRSPFVKVLRVALLAALIHSPVRAANFKAFSSEVYLGPDGAKIFLTVSGADTRNVLITATRAPTFETDVGAVQIEWFNALSERQRIARDVPPSVLNHPAISPRIDGINDAGIIVDMTPGTHVFWIRGVKQGVGDVIIDVVGLDDEPRLSSHVLLARQRARGMTGTTLQTVDLGQDGRNTYDVSCYLSGDNLPDENTVDTPGLLVAYDFNNDNPGLVYFGEIFTGISPEASAVQKDLISPVFESTNNVAITDRFEHLNSTSFYCSSSDYGGLFLLELHDNSVSETRPPVIYFHPRSNSVDPAGPGGVVVAAGASAIIGGHPTPSLRMSLDEPGFLPFRFSGSHVELLPTGSAGPLRSGAFQLELSGSGHVARSIPAFINALGEPSARLTNLSLNLPITAGREPTIAGFVLNGEGTKPVVLRAIGPGLRAFDVGNPHDDPQLTLFRGETLLKENARWSGDDGQSLGAFPLEPGSTDAVITEELANGSYTAFITGSDAVSGRVLTEIYDGDPDEDALRLMNLSSRVPLDAGDVLILGFVVEGERAANVTIRAVGPGLEAFGVTTPLLDPTLVLFSGSHIVTENDDWEGDDGSPLGAFPLVEGSRDSVLSATLSPGVYTVWCTAFDGHSAGTVLVEVYLDES